MRIWVTFELIYGWRNADTDFYDLVAVNGLVVSARTGVDWCPVSSRLKKNYLGLSRRLLEFFEFLFCGIGLLIVHFSSAPENCTKVNSLQFSLIIASSFFITSNLSNVNLTAASSLFKLCNLCMDSTLNNVESIQCWTAFHKIREFSLHLSPSPLVALECCAHRPLPLRLYFHSA